MINEKQTPTDNYEIPVVPFVTQERDGVQVWKWTRDSYYRAASEGWFEGRRVELIDGEIQEMAVMLGPHARAIMIWDDVLREVFGRGFRIRAQMPLDLGVAFQPEPDIAVVTQAAMDAAPASGHPSSAVLAVEVSDSTLRRDQNEKASVYASANIPEYIVVNLVDECIEVRRNPKPAPRARFGADYSSLHIFRRGDTFALLLRPDASLRVDNLLG